MKQERLVVVAVKRRRYRSYQGEVGTAPQNLLNRDFQAGASNRKWLTDITEFHLPAGKVSLSSVIDCFDGLVVSWSVGTRPDADLVNTMLDVAIETITDSADRPVVHSDRGAHFWTKKSRKTKFPAFFESSMDVGGCPWTKILERETSLELATSTLARLRSTN